VPFPPFRDLHDPDEKRREIVWIAISFIVILAVWLSVVLLFGYQPLIMGMTYDEVVLLTGLGLLVFCSILYLGAREREQRAANRKLVRQLKGAVESLDERLEQLNGLCSASAEIAGSLSIDHIAHAVTDSVLAALAADTSYLVLINTETGRPVYAKSAPALGAPGSDVSLDPEIGWAELLPSSGQIEDFETRLRPWNRDRTVMRVPMRLTEGLVGVLGVRRKDQETFNGDDLNLLTILGNVTAKAIESAQLHAELRDSYLATVRSLVASLHARDNYTASHSERVAALAVRMAEYLGLPDELVRDIEVFGPLHDVGKIGISDSVLLKPTPLSKDERDICREHCVIGEKIIRPLRPSRAALGMVRNHHEAWNGRGYPDGLQGEDIPRLARLLQVADAYDAMVSDRPYQAAMSEQEVLAHFKLYAGDRYDPVAVEALTAIVIEGLPEHETDHDGLVGALAPAETDQVLSVSSGDN